MSEQVNYIERQDRAITAPEYDALERGPFISSLIKALVYTESSGTSGEIKSRHSTGFVVGLTGEWGLGKSSVLNLLELELKQMKNVAVATLNPWLFKGRDELIEAYFNALREALGDNLDEKGRRVLTQLSRYRSSIEFVGSKAASLIDSMGAAGVATTIWEKCIIGLLNLLKKPETLSSSLERKNLEDKLADAKLAVVVLIDELDRVEDDEVRAVAQLIKAVGDIKGISYLVAYDPSRVAQALGRGESSEERQRTGESYLEKIIQLPIPLRPMFEEDVRDLLLQAMQNNNVMLPTSVAPYQADIFNQLLRAIRTPREIKRLIGAFAVLEEIMRGEICSFDVLAYSWLITKAPRLRVIIADNIDELVDDPGFTQPLARQLEADTAAGNENASHRVFGDLAQEYFGILEIIFSRLSDRHQRSADSLDGHRLAKRRNLVRLLYLGNPPGHFSRAEIERLWEIDSITVLEAELRLLKENGRLGYLLDRVGDFYAIFPESSDGIFWVAFARALVRTNDWTSGEEVEGGLVDDACSIMFRIARNSRRGSLRFRRIVAELISSEDLLIVPFILRRHLFTHGMTPYAPQHEDDYVFNESETVSLRDEELPRYRAAVEDGTALRRLPDNELIFCLVNSGCWDTQLRQNLTSQMDCIDAVCSFAALMVPPGVVIGYETLNTMLDAEAVLERANVLLREHGMPESEWLTASVRRLRAALARRSLHAIDAEHDDFDRD